ncbi:MAG: VOC family protein [Myxococcota bacterium]|nr:VOC family protein [Myxococcota bacterium]
MSIRAKAHHMSFPVTDLARSRRFYEDVLGLETIPRPDLGALGGVWYGAGACEVHLIEMPGGTQLTAPPAKTNPIDRHAAFAVEDYDATLAHLESHGLEVVQSPRGGQLWVQDPDGHIIELIVAGT